MYTSWEAHGEARLCLQMAEGGESGTMSSGLCSCMGGMRPESAMAQPVFTDSDSWEVCSHGLWEGGCLLFCGFQPSVLECIVSILFAPFMLASSMNVRVRTDAPSGSPWISQLVTKPLAQTA